MEKVQSKLKESIEKQTLKSLDRLADALETRDVEGIMTNDDANETDDRTVDNAEEPIKGENKVIINKHSKRKQKHGYRMKAIVSERKAVDKEKRKPKYHCAF
jgi:hypothetical protein